MDSPEDYRLVVSEVKTLAPGEYGGAVANCPSPLKAVGGGEENPSPYTALLKSSAPIAIPLPGGGSTSGWSARVFNAGSQPVGIRAYATCVGRIWSYQVKAHEMTVGPDGLVNGGARCPAGTQAYGGGHSIGFDDKTTAIQSSFPVRATNDSWYVVATSPTPGSAAKVTVFVVCGAGLNGVEVVGGYIQDNGYSVVQCQRGYYMLGGGWASNYERGKGNVDVTSSYPGQGTHTVYGRNQRFFADAVCALV